MDAAASIVIPHFPAVVRADARLARAMPDRISLRSKLLEVTETRRNRLPWRTLSQREYDDIQDPCRWREPVFAWLLAN